MNEQDFVDIVTARHGWAVGDQAQHILNGDDFDQQNDNALRYIMKDARKYEDYQDLAERIKDYLTKQEAK